MKRLFTLALFVLGAVALTLSAQGGNVTVIRGVTLIDGTGRAPVPNATVVIEGNTITDAGAHAQAPAGARIDRRHRQVPDPRHDRRAHPPARRARPRRPPADQERDGRPRAAQLSLRGRDDGLRRRQPVGVHHGAARQGAQRRASSARASSRPAAPSPARTGMAARTTSRRGPAIASCSTSTWRPSPTSRRSARTSTAGARGRRSTSCPRICSRRSSATTTRRACGSSSTSRTSTMRSKRSTPAPTRWRTRSSRRR